MIRYLIYGAIIYAFFQKDKWTVEDALGEGNAWIVRNGEHWADFFIEYDLIGAKEHYNLSSGMDVYNTRKPSEYQIFVSGGRHGILFNGFTGEIVRRISRA